GLLRRQRTFEGQVCSYRVVAASRDCVLLKPEQRNLTLRPRKRGQTGVPGQFGAFYPAASGATGRMIEQTIRQFIRTGPVPAVSRKRKGQRYQPDPARRREVEEKAIKFAWAHFQDELGYVMQDRQKDNCGYDLMATKDDEVLCIEVKGRSG